MTMNAAATIHSPVARSALRWARRNLFSSVWNTLLTVVSLTAIVFLSYSVLRWVFATADWAVIDANRRLFFVGQFPKEETWRAWASVYMLSTLAGVSWALWSTIRPQLAVLLAVALVPVFLLIGGGPVALLTAGAIALFCMSYVAGRIVATRGPLTLARNVAVACWIVSFLLSMFLLRGVDTRLWGGLLLTIVLTIVGIVAAFPIGILLALGRQSTFPVVRVFCVGYIEFIRGVPLITILFMAFFFLPLMIEPESSLFGATLPFTGHDLDLVGRAMVAIAMFSSAYLAETFRGGLQAVPRGQVEAAQALGLGTTRILAFIVLPQALRAVIPAIVGQLISLFKDTSLVTIIGLTELLGAARQVTAQREFFGTQAEALLFVALIYWIIAFSMSQASQRLERTLRVRGA